MSFTDFNRRIGKLLLTTSLLGMPFTTVYALTLAEEPLQMSGAGSAVPPNVMLMMDNSGSMTNLMWDTVTNPDGTISGYDSTQTYPDWSADNWSATANNEQFSPNDGVISTSHPTDTGDTYTLILPNPEGSETRYTGNYLNYLFDRTFAANPTAGGATVDLTSANANPPFVIPQNSRIKAAKNVATALVNNPRYTSIRFGVYKFNDSRDGGVLVQECGASQANLTSGIAGLGANSATPLASTYRDVIQYFRGKIGDNASPIQYRCQQNFAIVVTDGFPNEDMPTFSGTLPAPFVSVSPTPSFPDWDGDASNDGSGSKLFLLDDMAKMGYDIDLKTSGNDLEGISFNAAPYEQQRLLAHTIGFAINHKMLQDAADYAGGKYNKTASEAGLAAALDDALSSIASAPVTSVNSVTVNGGSVSALSRAYRAAYRQQGNDWVGTLTSVDISNSSPKAADVQLNLPATRTIYTYNGTAQINFSATDKAEFCPSCTVTEASAILSYLSGDSSREQRLGGSFRDRSTSVVGEDTVTNMGDIINSAPVFIAKPSFLYPDSLETAPYSTFKSANAQANRPTLVAVGANDGMLHLFNTSTNLEAMAYVPKILLSKITNLTDPAYPHQYFVDGSPTVGDAYYNDSWHTVLTTGLNKGGQGVIGLDVTNTTNFSNIRPWEFTDANDANMGYSYSQPAIVRMANGKWAAIFGNGFNSSEPDANTGAGNAVLYIVYLGVGENGFVADEFEVLNTVVTDATQGSDNGLATVAPVDINGDSIIDVIYAGDLNGDLWKFRVDSVDAATWKNTANIVKLFSTCITTPCTQSITTRPEVGRGPKSNSLMVYFGTGKYLEDTDPADTAVQSIYAVVDNLSSNASVLKTSLVEQTIEQQGTSFDVVDSDGTAITVTSTDNLRVTSNNGVNYASNNGWYMNLVFNNTNIGERIITSPILRNGRLIIASNYYTASNNGNNNETLSCNATDMTASGQGWLMQLDALYGGRLNYPPFDTDGNGDLNSSDLLGQVAASGKKFNENIATPTIISDGVKELIITAGSTTDVTTTTGNAGPGVDGIQSWTQF
ncbi:MAG: pilus assembly protein [Thiohalomonadales bacterium]